MFVWLHLQQTLVTREAVLVNWMGRRALRMGDLKIVPGTSGWITGDVSAGLGTLGGAATGRRGRIGVGLGRVRHVCFVWTLLLGGIFWRFGTVGMRPWIGGDGFEFLIRESCWWFCCFSICFWI